MKTMARQAVLRHRELIRAGGGEIDVVVDAPAGGRGQALVLLPSSQRDSLDFDALAHHLALSGHRVLRPQPRGMGRTTLPLEQLTLHALAQDVIDTVNALGDGRAVLVGHAFGHFIARVADMDHPQCVRGVVVAGAAARVFPPGMAESLDIACDSRQPDALRSAHLQRAFFAPGNDPTAWLEGWYPELRAAYRAAGAVPAKDRWWTVAHAPLLDLQGAHDPWRPPASRAELQDLLGAQRVTVQLIDQASHALVVEQPVAVAGAIARWVSGLPD
ncbi:alpha/beta fold hydrolase [Pantoea sp. 18069]|uniref:alpha/beta fold hydrolase n=1 Tax=Pantoea sp. 18069 TaxID=2681415 RepID=UPI00190F902D|nr:alpha/beta hydrolase [Pantoea sp. 18069]